MNTLRKLGLICAVLVLPAMFVGCGEVPEESSQKQETALVSSQIWTSPSTSTPGAAFTSSSYSCAGSTFYFHQPIIQAWSRSFGQYTDNLTSDATINSSRNETQIVCSSGSFMTDRSSYMDNDTARTCTVYAHLAGQGWTNSVTVTIPAQSWAYYPITTGFPSGYWGVGMQLPTSPSGWGTGYGTSCWDSIYHQKTVYIY